MAILPPFLAIFHKTEVQTVIFRYLTGLDLNWIKSYDTKRKKTQMSVFVQNSTKTEMEVFVFCVITFEPIKI